MSQQNNPEEKPSNKESALAVYLYAIVLTVIIGGVLSVLYTALKPTHDQNEEKARKEAILAAIPEKSEEDPLTRFDTRIKVIAVTAEGAVYDEAKLSELNAFSGRSLVQYKKISDIDLRLEDKLALNARVYPFYEYTANNGEKMYIVSVRGNGLWDKIWGNIALKADMSTIAGVYFGHKGETPGLGAEIKDDNKRFKPAFIGKTIYKNGVFAPLGVKKNNITANDVQAISGATVTSDGVHEMLLRGLGYYVPYIDKLKKS
jgi:Na+-transporting NADH:ubiquinone oxidoreductase subunit C